MDTTRRVLTAEHVMQRNVFALGPEQQVLDAVQALLQRGISGAPVVAGGRLVGMFSERDSLTAIASAHYEGEPPGTVSQHMRCRFKTVVPATDLYELANCFRETTLRRLPVVDASGRLLGLVSRGDVLRAMLVLYASERPKNPYQLMQDFLGTLTTFPS